MAFEYISAGKIDYYVNQSNAVIVDLRSSADYNRGHILNSVNVPYNNMEKYFDKLDANVGAYRGRVRGNSEINIGGVKADKNTIIVFYCERGSLSLAISSKMAKLGFNVKSVVGGIRQYRGRYLEKK